ncbi:hypothetical protein VNO77_42238 [Canavalia gladiata]|uniref:Uncharacterized protein n=1 Tax=Canavalia gladiata TaxID=3824 RepID=A0AAN9K3Q5_CANGL
MLTTIALPQVPQPLQELHWNSLRTTNTGKIKPYSIDQNQKQRGLRRVVSVLNFPLLKGCRFTIITYPSTPPPPPKWLTP